MSFSFLKGKMPTICAPYSNITSEYLFFVCFFFFCSCLHCLISPEFQFLLETGHVYSEQHIWNEKNAIIGTIKGKITVGLVSSLLSIDS